MTKDAHACDIKVAEAIGKLPYRADMIWQSVVRQIAIAMVMVCLGTARHAQPIDHHDGESQLRQGLRLPEITFALARLVGKSRRRLYRLRTAINVVNHRILRFRVQIRGPENYAVNIHAAIACLRFESFRLLPASPFQYTDIRLLELADRRSIRRAQQNHRRLIYRRVVVDEALAAGAKVIE